MRRLPCKINIVSPHGTYLSVQPDGRLEWDRTEAREYEEIVAMPCEGKPTIVAFKSYHGRYLSTNTCACNSDEIQEWEEFELLAPGCKYFGLSPMERLVSFYAVNDPDKNVGEIAEKYAGREEELFAALANKYGEAALAATDAAALAKKRGGRGGGASSGGGAGAPAPAPPIAVAVASPLPVAELV
jgi:hypothetical protein